LRRSACGFQVSDGDTSAFRRRQDRREPSAAD
jgi:hypothetical protein